MTYNTNVKGWIEGFVIGESYAQKNALFPKWIFIFVCIKQIISGFKSINNTM